MKQTIYKYNITITGEQAVVLPKHSKILTVQIQNNTLHLWALINEDEREHEKRIIEIFGTGHPLDSKIERRYINSFQSDGGYFVGHAFERL